MPFPIGHSLTSWGLAVLYRRKPLEFAEWRTALWWSLIAVSPDFDFAAVVVTHNRGYHRGFTHSLFTAVVVGFLLAIIIARSIDWYKIGLYILILASHGSLDWFFTRVGEGGPELFWPFNHGRYALGWFNRPMIGWHWRLPRLSGLLYLTFFELSVFLPFFLICMIIARYVYRPKQEGH